MSPVITVAETMDDLVERDGVYLKKLGGTPFSGFISDKTLRGELKNGKREGEWFFYAESNGKLLEKITYKNGLKDGEQITYGNLGAESKITWKEDKQNGPWVILNADGSVRSFAQIKNDELHGFAVDFYENRQVWSIGFFENGQRTGYWEFFDENGKKRYSAMKFDKMTVHQGSGVYKDGKKISD
jgi:antitoxin component YwqK of YwqJK toxin-antitoxin module